MTPELQDNLAHCEAVIERGLHTFYEVGAALLRIRDERLYRDKHATFEDYCLKRWEMTNRHANRLIEAAEVVTNLGPIGPTPQTESQARPLAALKPEYQQQAWASAVAQSPTGQPTAKEVDRVVKEDFLSVIKRKIAERELRDKPVPPLPAAIGPTPAERAEMAANAAHNNSVMNVIRAIETLAQPPIEVNEVAKWIIQFDTPDMNWPDQTRSALTNLRDLQKGLS